ncbi:hypothetical protein ACFWXK_27585 [Streptomyces sp. NPDC059070]|uniref:hypothetical protein n=1 Tax=Streptomyces sp. NPDC059070 TaxID=3346713 RepID=UPI00368ABCCE
MTDAGERNDGRAPPRAHHQASLAVIATIASEKLYGALRTGDPADAEPSTQQPLAD